MFCEMLEMEGGGSLLCPGYFKSTEGNEGCEMLIKARITISHAQWLLEAGNIRSQMARGGG